MPRILNNNFVMPDILPKAGYGSNPDFLEVDAAVDSLSGIRIRSKDFVTHMEGTRSRVENVFDRSRGSVLFRDGVVLDMAEYQQMVEHLLGWPEDDVTSEELQAITRGNEDVLMAVLERITK